MTRAAVVAEALTWLHTPYHHHGRIKGVGVDCAQILCAIYEYVGLVEPVDPGFYPVDWHLHRSEELYQGWLAKFGRLLGDGEQPQPGDVALFRFGRTFSHGGVLVEPDMVLHSYIGRGVTLTRLTEEPLADRPVQFWSLWSA